MRLVQEEVESRTISLCVSTTRLTARTLINALRMYQRHVEYSKHKKAAKDVKGVQGKVAVKDLLRDGDGVQSMPVSDGKLKDFERIANKYGVTFSVMKDKHEVPPRYLVFFKAKDQDAMTQVIKEYTAREMSRMQKPSILEQLRKLKEAAVEIVGKVHRREQELGR